MLLLSLTGCGGTGGYSDYYNPAWMADGRIIAVRDDVKTSNSGFAFSAGGSAEHSFKLVVMNGDGSGEHVVKDNADGVFSLNVSPSGNYIAYHGGDKLVILDRNYQTHSTIYWKETASDSLFEFDWSPDESKLVLDTSSGVRLYARAGSKIRVMTNLRSAHVWKYGEHILGSTLVGDSSYRALVTETDILLLAAGSQVVGISYLSGGEYYFGGGGSAGYRKVKTSDFSTIETYPTLNSVIKSVSGGGVQVNPVDAGEVMYSAGPGSTQSYGREGIYLIRLDGSKNRQLRK